MPGGSEEAFTSARASGEVRPNAVVLVSLAHTLCDAGRIMEAEELCRLLLRDQPRLAVARAALGRALYEGGRFDEAEIWLERTIRQTPGCFAAYRWLGEVLVHKRIWDRADAVLIQAAVLSPENGRVQQLRAQIPRDPAGAAIASPPGAAQPSWGEPPTKVTNLQNLASGSLAYPDDMRALSHTTEVAPDDEPPRRTGPRATDAAGADVAIDVDLSDGLGGRIRRATVTVWRRSRWVAVGAGALVGAALGLVALGRLNREERALGPARPSSSAPVAPAPAPPRPAPDAPAGKARQALEQAVATGTLDALLDAQQGAAAHLTSPDVAAAQAFAVALLATEYGLPVADQSRALLRRVTEGPVPERLAAEIEATRILLGLTGGGTDPADRAGARNVTASGPTGTWLTFAREKAARYRGQPATGAATARFALGAVLEAERLLDAGNAVGARKALAPVVAQAPLSSRAQLAMVEARDALGVPATAAELSAFKRSCASDGRISPVIAAGCELALAGDLRRAGNRSESRARALVIGALAPAEPRVLALTAQLLANLGETRHAEALVNKARGYAAAEFPPLAWASLALRINRGEQVTIDKTLTVSGPESRMLAVRAAFARGGAAGVHQALAGVTSPQVAADHDLRWFAVLPRVGDPKTAVRLATRYASDGEQRPGAVGSYVLGLLARWGGRRHLAAQWLARAREGHGDACGAAMVYAAVLKDLAYRTIPPVPAECTPPKQPPAPTRTPPTR